MNFLRTVRGMHFSKAPFQQFSGSSNKTSYSFFLNTLSLVRKAPKTAFKLTTLSFGCATTYYSYQAYQGYKNLKNEAKEALNPLSKALEKIGIKKPEVKEENLTEKISSFFQSILASDPSLEANPLPAPRPAIKELEPLLIKGIERLEQIIAPPPKDNSHPEDPLITEKPPKKLKEALTSLAKTGKMKIIYELECKKEQLKKEISDSDE